VQDENGHTIRFSSFAKLVPEKPIFQGMRRHIQLAIHTSAHFSEEEQLMKSLLRNKDSFSKKGVAVLGPGKYRRLIKQPLQLRVRVTYCLMQLWTKKMPNA
jgi:hypothetical protein